MAAAVALAFSSRRNFRHKKTTPIIKIAPVTDPAMAPAIFWFILSPNFLDMLDSVAVCPPVVLDEVDADVLPATIELGLKMIELLGVMIIEFSEQV